MQLLKYLMILLLIITPLLAHDIKGSLSWLTIGPISLQPAEFAKCFTAIAVAKYMSQYGYKVRDFRDLIVPFLLIGIPMLIIMIAQRETGSALVFGSFLLVFYRQGMSGYVLSGGVVCVVLFLLVILFSETSLPIGLGNMGQLLSTLVIHAIVIALLGFKQRDIRAVIIVGIGVVVCYGIGLLVNIWIPVNMNYIGIASLIFTVIYLLLHALVDRRSSLGWIIGFVILVTSLCQGCDFAFNNILQEHQRF